MSQVQPPSGPVRNLSIWDSVTESFSTVFSVHPADLPRAMAFPLLLSVLIGLLQVWMTPDMAIENPADTPGSITLTLVVVSLLGLIPYVLFCVSWNRLVLLNEQPPWVMMWTSLHWFFLIYSIAIVLILLGASLVFGFALSFLQSVVGGSVLNLIVGLAGVLAIVVVSLRLSFVLPAVSVGERYGLSDAWRHSRGQGLRMLAAVILMYIPIIIASVIATLLLSLLGLPILILSSDGGMQSPSLIVNIFWFAASGAIGYLVLAITQSFIAIAFRACSGWVPGPPCAPLTAGPFEHDGPGEA